MIRKNYLSEEESQGHFKSVWPHSACIAATTFYLQLLRGFGKSSRRSAAPRRPATPAGDAPLCPVRLQSCHPAVRCDSNRVIPPSGATPILSPRRPVRLQSCLTTARCDSDPLTSPILSPAQTHANGRTAPRDPSDRDSPSPLFCRPTTASSFQLAC